MVPRECQLSQEHLSLRSFTPLEFQVSVGIFRFHLAMPTSAQRSHFKTVFVSPLRNPNYLCSFPSLHSPTAVHRITTGPLVTILPPVCQIPWNHNYLAWSPNFNLLTTYTCRLRFPPFESLSEQPQNIPPPRSLLGEEGLRDTGALLSVT